MNFFKKLSTIFKNDKDTISIDSVSKWSSKRIEKFFKKYEKTCTSFELEGGRSIVSFTDYHPCFYRKSDTSFNPDVVLYKEKNIWETAKELNKLGLLK